MLLFTSFPNYNSLIIHTFDAVLSEILTASLNKKQKKKKKKIYPHSTWKETPERMYSLVICISSFIVHYCYEMFTFLCAVRISSCFRRVARCFSAKKSSRCTSETYCGTEAITNVPPFLLTVFVWPESVTWTVILRAVIGRK
jgi:hypothetical protein